ncbi:MAG: hypothetical protein HN982_03835 [Candidatus Marinimicrobia bacterium]|jgi:hypothetical protein|nr:hypothetical protein [Candidatus Woesearchaeota archaeon]MBT6936698.1 hypothetical protein [Candidatus Neomarinimicrobiota bacterium]
MRSKQHGRRLRREGAIERIGTTILVYEEQLKSNKSDDEKKLLKKKIEGARTTIENTKENMK